jgi:uncharacterized repeat protein (TIGR03806 family)
VRRVTATRWLLAVMLVATACRKEAAPARAHDDWRVEPRPAAPVELTGLTFPLDPPTLTPLVAVPAFEALKFDKSLWLGHARDGSGRVYVAEQDGRIHVFDGRADVQTKRVFLDIRDRVRTQHNEEGLLGVAFAPDFARTRHLFVYYSASQPRRVVVSRFTAKGDVADPASERVLIEIDQPYGNHNGGWIDFGPDGALYLGVGDGGSAGDPGNRAQDPGSLLGKILRLQVAADGGPIVPPDNPFVGRKGWRPEIWALGLRNPWRCSFDRQQGELWCGDVGQDRLEEIDVIVKGGNYGWRMFEASKPYEPTADMPADLVPPVHEYGRHDGQSVTGGFVYRGTHLPGFRGAYFFGDFATGSVWTLDRDGDKVVGSRLVANVPMLAAFGEDEAGELYAVSHEGRIYRFEHAERGDAAAAFPTLLSETGLFTDTAALVPNPGLLAYDVNVELWSDGARKQRWLAVPRGTTIAFAAEGGWTFPVGTVAVKHFELEVAADDGATRWRRLETRVMVHESRGWAGYTYRWNDDESDAELVGSPVDETFAVRREGKVESQRWSFPAGSDCLRCHTRAYGELLGVRTRQLAGRSDAAGESLLASWVARGVLTGAPADLAALPAHPRLDDDAAPVADRVRAYLDVNCATCHLPHGPAPSAMDLRVQTPLGSAALADAPPDAPLGVAGERRVAAGNPDASAMVLRMSTRERGAMPPLASNRVHDVGVALVRGWISGL